MAWPAHLANLMSLDFLLWGYLMSEAFENRPAKIQELKATICHEIIAFPAANLQKVGAGTRAPKITEPISKKSSLNFDF